MKTKIKIFVFSFTVVILFVLLSQTITVSSKKPSETNREYIIIGISENPAYENLPSEKIDLSRINYEGYGINTVIRPMFGQSSVYQAEEPGTWDRKFPGYGYMESETGRDTLDVWKGETVKARCCIKSEGDREGYIVKGLYENCEQVNIPDETLYEELNTISEYRSDIKYSKYVSRWYIKPRIRIDSLYALYHPSDTVATIIIKRFDGEIIDSIVLKCLHFLKEDGNSTQLSYNGGYIEKYEEITPYGMYDTALSVKSKNLLEGRGNNSVWRSRVDYAIYWNGKVDMFLDYVKVEDNWANMFLNQKQEEEVFSNCDVWKFSTRLKSEIKDRQQDSRILEIEGLGYNNLRCVNEIIKKIDEYSGGKIKILIKTDAEGLVTNGGLRNGPDKLHILAHNK